MQRKMSLKFLALLTTLCISGCSKPPVQPHIQVTPAAAPQPQLPEPQPAPADAAGDQKTDQSISINISEPAKFREFMATLQQAVQKHDADAVATLVNYPIDINPHTKGLLHIRTPDAFIAQYDSIVTPHIAEVITKQKYGNLFVNYQGAMFGNGEVWIAGICQDKACQQTDIKVKTIQNTENDKKN